VPVIKAKKENITFGTVPHSTSVFTVQLRYAAYAPMGSIIQANNTHPTICPVSYSVGAARVGACGAFTVVAGTVAVVVGAFTVVAGTVAVVVGAFTVVADAAVVVAGVVADAVAGVVAVVAGVVAVAAVLESVNFSYIVVATSFVNIASIS
jgi:hypothetical protein